MSLFPWNRIVRGGPLFAVSPRRCPNQHWKVHCPLVRSIVLFFLNRNHRLLLIISVSSKRDASRVSPENRLVSDTEQVEHLFKCAWDRCLFVVTDGPSRSTIFARGRKKSAKLIQQNKSYSVAYFYSWHYDLASYLLATFRPLPG